MQPYPLNVTRLVLPGVNIYGVAPTRDGRSWPYEQLLRNVTAELVNDNCTKRADLCPSVALPLDEVL